MADKLRKEVIGAAVEVHRDEGPVIQMRNAMIDPGSRGRGGFLQKGTKATKVGTKGEIRDLACWVSELCL